MSQSSKLRHSSGIHPSRAVRGLIDCATSAREASFSACTLSGEAGLSVWSLMLVV